MLFLKIAAAAGLRGWPTRPGGLIWAAGRLPVPAVAGACPICVAWTETSL